MFRLVLISFAAVLLPNTVNAEVRLASLFTDHAILQRDRPLPVWGTANPGEMIRVTLGNATAATTTDDAGRWMVKLEAQPVTTSPVVLRVTGESETLQRSDILLGDVWHASGQSNMAMNVDACARALPEVGKMIESANLPWIRFVRINEGQSPEPRSDLGATPQWVSCSPNTAAGFSAAAFFFARRIHQEIDVPIGIIDSSRGGTPIEPFIPRHAFDDHPTLVRERELGDSNDLAGIWRLPGGVRARDANWLPGRLYNSRIAPIASFAVRGMIWYQAESNSGKLEDPRDYQHKMRALVNGWRTALGDSSLPVYFVQLPGSGAGDNWPYMREQQRLAADIPNTGIVVTIDLEHPDIHPPNKVDVGERLARWALAEHYGLPVPFSGPLFSAATIKGSTVTLRFSHARAGLMVATKQGLEPPIEQPDERLKHFEVVDASGDWHPADAVIADTALMVTSANVPHPVAVRYAYAVSPIGCNLYNRDGLPASPFCTRPDLLTCDPGLPVE